MASSTRDTTDEVARLKNLVKSLEEQNIALRARKPSNSIRASSASSNNSSISEDCPSPAGRGPTPKRSSTPADTSTRRKTGTNGSSNKPLLNSYLSNPGDEDDILDLTSSDCQIDDEISWLYVSPSKYKPSTPVSPAHIRSQVLATFSSLGERRPISSYNSSPQLESLSNGAENTPTLSSRRSPASRQLDLGYQSLSSQSDSSSQPLSSNHSSDTARTDTPSSPLEACSPTDYAVNSRTFTRTKRNRRPAKPPSEAPSEPVADPSPILPPTDLSLASNAAAVGAGDDPYKTFRKNTMTLGEDAVSAVDKLRKGREESGSPNAVENDEPTEISERPIRKKTQTIDASHVLAAQRLAAGDAAAEFLEAEQSEDVLPELKMRVKKSSAAVDADRKSKRESLDIQTLARMQEESLRESFTALRKASMSPIPGQNGRSSPFGRRSPATVGRASPAGHQSPATVPALNFTDLDSSGGSTSSSRTGSSRRDDPNLSGSGTFRVKKHTTNSSGRSSPVAMNGDTPIIHKPASTPPASTGPLIKSSLSPRGVSARAAVSSGLPKPRSALPAPSTRKSGAAGRGSGLRPPSKR